MVILLNGHELPQTPGDNRGQKGVVCCGHGGKESDVSNTQTTAKNLEITHSYQFKGLHRKGF